MMIRNISSSGSFSRAPPAAQTPLPSQGHSTHHHSCFVPADRPHNHAVIDDNSSCNETPATPDLNRCDVRVHSIGTPDQVTSAVDEEPPQSSRRRSTFYVALDHQTDDSLDLSACSLDWSLNESVSSDGGATGNAVTEEHKPVPQPEEPIHRLEILVNEAEGCRGTLVSTSSTPKNYLAESRTRVNILNFPERISISPAVSPLKEKSKTLPQNFNNSAKQESASPRAKHSCLVRSSPKISMSKQTTPASQTVIPLTAKSPRKSLSFIRRSHSTKVSRSSSLLRSFTTSNKNADGDLRLEGDGNGTPYMIGLNAELLLKLYRLSAEDSDESIRRIFLKDDQDPCVEYSRVLAGDHESRAGDKCDDEDGIHSGKLLEISSHFLI